LVFVGPRVRKLQPSKANPNERKGGREKRHRNEVASVKPFHFIPVAFLYDAPFGRKVRKTGRRESVKSDLYHRIRLGPLYHPTVLTQKNDSSSVVEPYLQSYAHFHTLTRSSTHIYTQLTRSESKCANINFISAMYLGNVYEHVFNKS